MIYIYKILSRIKCQIYKMHLKIKYGNKIKIGKNVVFRKKVIVTIEKGGKLIIGDNCFFNNNCSINCMNYIDIGKNNLFGENIKIYDHDHKINTIYRQKKFNLGTIKIGDNNWFGSDCIILRKANIGDNNVFACKCVINEIIKSNVLCKMVYDFNKEKIAYQEE